MPIFKLPFWIDHPLAIGCSCFTFAIVFFFVAHTKEEKLSNLVSVLASIPNFGIDLLLSEKNERIVLVKRISKFLFYFFLLMSFFSFSISTDIIANGDTVNLIEEHPVLFEKIKDISDDEIVEEVLNRQKDL